MPFFLEAMPWPEIGRARRELGGMLLLPLGATEQHGPHLPVNTDTVIAQAVCWFASAKTGVPVLPALPYTVSAGHTAKWPGTFSVSHGTLIDALMDIADWVAATGWSRLLFVNAHFGNDASMRVAVDQIRYALMGKLQVGCLNSFSLTPAIWEYFISDAEDLHANKAETDLMLYLAPHLVRMDAVEDDPDRTGGTVFSYPVAQTSLNGVTGKPSQGTAERGQSLLEEMGAALASAVAQATTESAPLEPENWSDIPRLRSALFRNTA